MAIVSVTLRPYDPVANTVIGEVDLTIESTTRQAMAASGTIYGKPISGLSGYLSATNTVYEANSRFLISGREFSYNFEDLSVSAGGVDYNLKGNRSAPPGSTLPVTIVGSDGTQQTANVSSPLQSQDFLCFVSGTCIETERGPIPVEGLRLGDIAVTASGGRRPVIWIGHRTVETRPVRIASGAFGEGLPLRPLYLSPGHPVLVGADEDGQGGSLVPIMCLENGTSIARTISAPVTYWHVELDAHDILLAEGLPAESYIDGGDRAFFSEASDHALHNPDFIPPGWDARCRPVLIDGPLVEAERLRLNAIFADGLDRHSAWTCGELAL